jgi:hypothetical protein
MPVSTLPSPKEALQAHRKEYQDNLDQIRHLQELLKEDVAELEAQEGWEMVVRMGVDEWAADTGMVWRALRVSLVG